MEEPWGEVPKCVEANQQSWVPGEVPWEPRELKGGLRWSELALDTEEGLEEFKAFLDAHYVRGDNYGLQYTKQVLKGANMPPGFHTEWHVAVRTKKGALMATITAVPADFIQPKNNRVTSRAIINFLCVHDKLRVKRLAPVLIQEVARRIADKQVWEAIYTAVAHLPRPIASPHYQHMIVDVSYLTRVGFIDRSVPRIKLSRNIHLHKVQEHHIPHLFQLYQNFILNTQPTLALHFKSMLLFQHEIHGPHKYAVVTQDMRNFAAFVLIPSTHLTRNTHIQAAYLTLCVATSIPHTTFLRQATAHLPTHHLLNILTSTNTTPSHTPLHTPSPLHFFTYNSTITHTHFLPFAFN